MDVLTVERRDERAVEPIHHFVGDLVGLVLEPLDGFHLGSTALGRRGEQLLEMLRRFLVTRGDGNEQVEELFFPGQQAHGRLLAECGESVAGQDSGARREPLG